MKKYIAICLATILIILVGCGTNRIVVKERPADPVYYRPAPPNPSFVWIGSGYVKKAGKYEYRNGYWATPPNSRHRWIEGRWKETRRGWIWVGGHWN